MIRSWPLFTRPTITGQPPIRTPTRPASTPSWKRWRALTLTATAPSPATKWSTAASWPSSDRGAEAA